MAPWITLLVGLVACLGFALAAPVEESASDVTPVCYIIIEMKLYTDRNQGRTEGRRRSLPLLAPDPS